MWKKFKKRWEILNGISRPLDVILMLRIFSFYVVVNPILHKISLRSLANFLEPLSPPATPDLNKAARINEYINALVKVGRPLIPSRCFTRGTMLYYFLRRSGLKVNLVFGVEKKGAAFMGHCWLERDGVPYLEVNDPRKVYIPMYTIISGTAHLY
jgi:hypothetical protein